MKTFGHWRSPRLHRETTLVRWGEVGRPVLVFPTAGGDAEEIERFLMIKVLRPLLEQGRIKIYSIDSIAAATWGDPAYSAEHSAWLQNQFDGYVYHEVVPAIRTDCGSDDIDVIVAGASIGAFQSMAAICRHPDVFSHAICMSGTYDVERFVKGHHGERIHPGEPNFYFSSPRHFLPNLGESWQVQALRQRFILLAHGNGQWEDPDQDWTMASILGSKAIPNRVDDWGPSYDHDWMTWRDMLPTYLDQLC